MSNLGYLLKNNIKCMLGVIQGKKTRKKFGVVIALCVLGYLGISAIFALQIYGLFQTMGEIGLGQIPLFNSFQIALLILIVLTFQSISEKAQTNDSDLLLSMPIKKIDIILSKSLSKYLFNLALVSIVIIPTIVLYCIYFQVIASVIFWCLLLMLILPFFGVGINYILNYIITRFFNKTKFSTLLKTLLAIILFGGFIALYIYSSSVMGLQDFSTIDSFLNSNFLVGMCVRVIYYNDLLNLLYLCLIVFGVFALGMCGYASIFGKNFLGYSQSHMQIKFSSPTYFNGLIKKEIKKYFSTPILIVNTIIGPIVLIALTIFACIEGSDGINLFLGIDSKDTVFLFMLMWLMMCASTLISCCTISLEGKYLWILKSTPVQPKKILFAKSLINMLVFMPVHIITSIVMIIILRCGVLESIGFILLPILLNITLSFGGTYINLLLPKLEWEVESQVVKQSASLVVTMIVGYIIALVPTILNLFTISMSTIIIISLAVYLVLAVGAIALLFTSGVNKFNKLSC